MLGYILQNLVILSVCVFAMRAGQLPEKIAGLWLATNVVVFAIAIAFDKQSPTQGLICDAIFAIGLLPLAVLFASWYIGAMCIIQACSFMLQAFYLINDLPVDALFFNLTTATCWGGVLTLLLGTLASVRERRSRRPPMRTGSAIPAV